MGYVKLGIILLFALFLSLALCLSGPEEAQARIEDRVQIAPVAYVAPATSREETRVPEVAPAELFLSVERLLPVLVPKAGPGYKRSSVVKHSRYLQGISGEGLRGNSRRWGDADLSVQAECVRRLVNELQAADYSIDEIAFAVAVWRCESGFNPDAAAGTSSACGLGQFLDRTRAVLCKRAGIANDDPFSVDLNVVCTRETLEECFAFARKRAKRGSRSYFEYAYAYHHDGPSLNSGGLEIAKSKVLPWLETAKKCISQ